MFLDEFCFAIWMKVPDRHVGKLGHVFAVREMFEVTRAASP